jgi:hypothetical protein|tara:strand:+ start:1804 stop:2100 length:297 start_codon:yes stop_codon:yes gene_type:complete
MIIEYKLHPVASASMTTPNFVRDGGHWYNPDDHTYIGVVPSNAEYYIPDTLVILTASELEARQLAIHAKYPFNKPEESRDMTIDEVKKVVADWVSARE